MVKLSDALGALLRDITYSRVKADMFSRNAGLEYLKDPILKLFPVPRAEIRSVEIDLAFAVTELQPEPVEAGTIALPRVTAHLPELVARVLSVSMRKGRSARESVPLRERLGATSAQFENNLAQRLHEHLRSNLEDLVRLLLREPEAFAKEVSRRILAELRASLGSAVGVDAQNEIQAFAGEWAKALGAEIRPALEKSKPELAVQVAVTREELADVPQSTLARVKATVEIQNYDWVEYDDENGASVQKLVPR